MGHQQGEAVLKRLRVGPCPRFCHLFVLSDVPVGEQLQLTLQQRLVIGGQHIRAGGLLPQSTGHPAPCQTKPRCVAWRLVKRLHHGVLAPKIVEQHKTLGSVPSQHLGRQQARRMHHQLGNFVTKGWLFSLSGGASMMIKLVSAIGHRP